MVTVEPPKLSPAINVGLVKPVVSAVNVNLAPGRIILPGEILCIVTAGGGKTVMVCETVALLAELSVTVTVMVWVPTSATPGVHRKDPARLRFSFDIDDADPNESEI